jgi:integrase
LPITQQAAAEIRAWQQVRAGVYIAPASADHLFPARTCSAPLPYLRTQTVGEALRCWVRLINRNVVGPAGQLRPLEGVSVYAYAFRHTYAQRHADAGVPFDVLRDLMDHKHIGTTIVLPLESWRLPLCCGRLVCSESFVLDGGPSMRPNCVGVGCCRSPGTRAPRPGAHGSWW